MHSLLAQNVERLVVTVDHSCSFQYSSLFRLLPVLTPCVTSYLNLAVHLTLCPTNWTALGIMPLHWNWRIDSPMSRVCLQHKVAPFWHKHSFLDPHAEEKALWVQAKRTVLAILRVQPAKDLVECLMQPVSEEHEMFWEDIVDRELMTDHMRQRQRRMPSTTGAESAYRLDDIKSYVTCASVQVLVDKRNHVGWASRKLKHTRYTSFLNWKSKERSQERMAIRGF